MHMRCKFREPRVSSQELSTYIIQTFILFNWVQKRVFFLTFRIVKHMFLQLISIICFAHFEVQTPKFSHWTWVEILMRKYALNTKVIGWNLFSMGELWLRIGFVFYFLLNAEILSVFAFLAIFKKSFDCQLNLSFLPIILAFSIFIATFGQRAIVTIIVTFTFIRQIYFVRKVWSFNYLMVILVAGLFC